MIGYKGTYLPVVHETMELGPSVKLDKGNPSLCQRKLYHETTVPPSRSGEKSKYHHIAPSCSEFAERLVALRLQHTTNHSASYHSLVFQQRKDAHTHDLPSPSAAARPKACPNIHLQRCRPTQLSTPTSLPFHALCPPPGVSPPTMALPDH